jgi:undecaprenyl-diphosphatase
MKFFSEALNYPSVKVVLGVFLLAMLIASAVTRKTVFQALIAVAVGNSITDVFKHVWPMHRPFQELKGVIMWVGTSDSFGTASAHSANMAAVAFVFVYHLRWWGTPWVAIAVITGFSRVFCGAHYPYQVLLGWTTGILTAAAVTYGWDFVVKKRNTIQAETTTA